MTDSHPATPERPNVVSEVPHPQPKSVRWWLSRLVTAGILLGVGILLLFLLGIAQRAGWIQEGTSQNTASSSQTGEQIFTCPMHPQIRQPSPGKCPICGMDLVPAASAGTNLDEFAVTINPAQRRVANIQTAKATKQPVSMTIRTIGAIQIDESRQATIAAYIDGRVERMFADYTGVMVEKGDHLAVVYSPQLYSAQVEYIEAKKTVEQMSGGVLGSVRQIQEKLVTNSRQKLVELGVTDEQLKELEVSNQPQSRLTIYAPMGGTVTEKFTEEGKYIKAGEPIYRIANLSTVWLMLELYPEDASQIRFGQRVDAELQSLPGRKLTGRIAFVDPTVDPMKRTVGVRVEFNNENGQLRPGDYAEATIQIPVGPQGEVFDEDLAGKWISPMHPQIIRDESGECPICGMQLVPTSQYGYGDKPVSQIESITVPRSAVLMAGQDSVIYVETKPGRFELRNVSLGPILKDRAVILSGVEPGEKVATAGNFLIDSQMQLTGKPSLIDPKRAIAKDEEEYRNTPLSFNPIEIKRISDPAGVKLEQLYRNYFSIQRALASDKKPAETDALALYKLATELAQETALDESTKELLLEIVKQSEHLHHLDLESARKTFKTISHAVVTLATKVRGVDSTQPFYQFFCPMVMQGEGDWLQGDDKLRNPYFGSEMLHCGELVQAIRPDEPAKKTTPNEPLSGSASPSQQKEQD